MKNVQKGNKICYCLGGGDLNLGGKMSPPKGLEKNTDPSYPRTSVFLPFYQTVYLVRRDVSR